MSTSGLLIVVSGFSGGGKGTLVELLMKRYPEEYALSISATSRAPKDKETEGVNYFYKTREEFEKMISEGRFLEYAVYNDDYYGWKDLRGAIVTRARGGWVINMPDPIQIR